MNNNYIFFLLLLTMISVHSQNKETVYIWPDKTPSNDQIIEKTTQSRVSSGMITKITEVKYPSFTVYKPKSISNGVGVIVNPGGGYNILAIDLEGEEVAEWLTELGYTVFLLKYSVPKKEAEALNDLKRTIRIVRNDAEKYKIDAAKIGVLGFSAGGSLSARASTLYNKETYTEIDAIDTVSSRPDFSVLIYPAYLDKGENYSITPELKITKNTPPMFVFATSDDAHGNSSLVIAKALNDARVPVELHFLTDGGHGYGLRTGNVAAEAWPKLLEAWLKKTLLN
ncbi:alpha/beta hydrolase [Lutibacter sp. A64]|uniref:alpha/beta hydrolase n=1 Tax=Lutibacter sp. A64 TaxID=2918526 RepID=UPI001F06FAEA|nr:alpha/beta hydrolase [Lutibacter sp. A64]UMB52406.1 alpha/beta hydrolase [Lutibacter sp. A64]